MIIKYRGTFSYDADKLKGHYDLFDIVNNKSEERVYVEGTREECMYQYGLAQKDYYIKYPRLLPKGISISQGKRKTHFQLYLRKPDGKTIFIGAFVTVQEAMQYKKDLISINTE